MLQLQAALSPAEVHYNLGSVYEQQGKIEQARAEYQEAIKLDPKLIDAQLFGRSPLPLQRQQKCNHRLLPASMRVFFSVVAVRRAGLTNSALIASLVK